MRKNWLRKIGNLGLGALVLASMIMLAACGSNDNKDQSPEQTQNAKQEGEDEQAQGEAPSTETTAAEADKDQPKLTQLKVGATAVPHAAILEAIKPELKEKGIELEIVEFADYVQPNRALLDQQLDANFFQHTPHLDNFNEENGANLVSAVMTHYEPLGIFPSKTTSLDSLPDGAEVAVPNDTSNEARALQLLNDFGLIKLKADAGFSATIADIEENPKNLKIHEVEAAQLPRMLPDVDLAVINGNFALDAGLKIEEALGAENTASEEAKASAEKEFGNIVAVRSGDENREEIKALVEAITSETAKQFIENTYSGAVIPLF